MALLAVVGGLFLCAALAIREYQLAKERITMTTAFDHLRRSLDSTRSQLQRALEDLYVLQSTMVERNVVDEGELAEGRARLVEAPKRKAQERRAILKHVAANPTQVVVDESHTKLLH